MEKVKIFIADDNKETRDEIKKILESQRDLTVIGEASNGLEAIEKIESFEPDILLMDIVMPKLNGLEATRSILKRHPHMKALILAYYYDEGLIEETDKIGVQGHIIKSTLHSELIHAITMVKNGWQYYFNMRMPENRKKKNGTIPGKNTNPKEDSKQNITPLNNNNLKSD